MKKDFAIQLKILLIKKKVPHMHKKITSSENKIPTIQKRNKNIPFNL
jgi:hypothetical protein